MVLCVPYISLLPYLSTCVLIYVRIYVRTYLFTCVRVCAFFEGGVYLPSGIHDGATATRTI